MLTSLADSLKSTGLKEYTAEDWISIPIYITGVAYRGQLG